MLPLFYLQVLFGTLLPTVTAREAHLVRRTTFTAYCITGKKLLLKMVAILWNPSMTHKSNLVETDWVKLIFSRSTCCTAALKVAIPLIHTTMWKILGRVQVFTLCLTPSHNRCISNFTPDYLFWLGVVQVKHIFSLV